MLRVVTHPRSAEYARRAKANSYQYQFMIGIFADSMPGKEFCMRSRTNGASNRTIAEGTNSRGGRPRDGVSRLKRRDMIRLGVASMGAGMVSGFDVVAAGA